MYTIHSWDVPYTQENGSFNFCWRAFDGSVAIRPFCQVFQARMPALYQHARDQNDTVSFESMCHPGYYIRQKNYHIILGKRDGSDLFGKSDLKTKARHI